ncbi:hypothetical protein DFA_07392 [Cavenderia fasciculata]|uniref:Transmembrane protein n=1 Tax=Cavenderia fasciculata TaxID=261658 RepID=F4PWA5_CACFS|nr:uncharacterized protein DFA_07392 [Cavenderia fasciculata]EGG20269.1 hypothetical protein DFA_07392 [Cavenderia fasciculata]|eukprot:XP_004367252.1 hypothetical protein DFA_07392 [Cavenderia fasciculata]
MVLTETERALQALIAFGTNLSCLPLGIMCVKRGTAYEAIVGTACALCSMLYHVGEVYEKTWWFKLSGMTSGQWHRLDNIFTILAFQALMFYLTDVSNPQIMDLLRWTFLVFTLYCQERAPWDITYTILPIGASFLLLIVSHLYRRRVPEWIKNRYFLYGLGCLVVAGFFFARGLDDDTDYLRWNHGVWHFFIGIAFFFIFQSRDKSVKDLYYH